MTNTLPFHHCIFSLNQWYIVKKFHFRNIVRRFLNLFLLEHHRLKDVFLGAPSEDRPQQTECSLEVHLEVFSGCVPEETHVDADYDWKTSQSLKVRQTSVYALTVRLYLWVSDLVRFDSSV